MTTINSGNNSILANEIQKSFKDDNRIDRKELAQLKQLINTSDLDPAVKEKLTNFLEKAKDASYTFFGIFESKITANELEKLGNEFNKVKALIGDNPIGKELCNAIEPFLPVKTTPSNNNDQSGVKTHKPSFFKPVSDIFNDTFHPKTPVTTDRYPDLIRTDTPDFKYTDDTSNRSGLLRTDVANFHLTQYTGSRSQGGDCGPTSGAMILRSFGINASVADVRSNAPDKPSRAPWALSEGQISSSINKLSGGKVRQSGDTEQYSPRNQQKLMDDIKAQLSEGKMVMLCTGNSRSSSDSRHYIVITGMDANNNLQYADPAISQNGSGPMYMSPEQLTQRMNNADGIGRPTTLTAYQKVGN